MFFQLSYDNNLNYVLLPLCFIIMTIYNYIRYKKYENKLYINLTMVISGIIVFIAFTAILQVATFKNSLISGFILFAIGVFITLYLSSYIINLVRKSNDKLEDIIKASSESSINVSTELAGSAGEIEEIIKEKNKRLLELDQMRKELITRVSHELKTPLTFIVNSTELLLEHYTERIDDDILKIIEIIHRGGRRLNELIKNALDASQMDSGKLNLYKENANLVKIIKNSIKYIELLAVNRNHSLNIELPEELYLEVDKIRIKQVLTNLLSNAIKNTPSNGKIDVSLRKNGIHCYISIKDTGVGFTEKEMEKIFKKFGKIERYGKQLDVDIEGSGLGLYISKEIVELHDGKIWVESEGKNKGSTFIIKLPMNYSL